MDMTDAVALIHPTDSLAVPLGPGAPGGFLHALGVRTDFTDLQIDLAPRVGDAVSVAVVPGVTQPASNIVPASVPLVMGDRPYSELFEAQQASIYRLTLMLYGNPDVAEETVAEVFARVLPKWRQGAVTDPVFSLRRAVVSEAR